MLFIESLSNVCCILTDTLSPRFIDNSEGVASRFPPNDNITFGVSEQHKRKGQNDVFTERRCRALGGAEI